MSSIQKILDSLQPYVIGIRYVEGLPLLDVVFKEGWTVPEDPKVTKVKGEESLNYYMFYSDKGLGIDELLTFVEKTIKINLEREKKQILLKLKVEELKKIFRDNSLEKLNKLKFVLPNDELTTSLTDFDLDISSEEPSTQEVSIETPSSTHNPVIYTPEMIEKLAEEENTIPMPPQYLDEHGNPIEYTEEELEMIEEEARAAKFFNSKKNKNKVELPPR
jgi:hypothetical protein